MKSTGMVRRIDALGRVVIPKEIRRTMKIRENDPLEIFIDDDQVVFKKYSAVFELESTSQQLAEILYKQQNMTVIVCDMDKVIAVAGVPKKELINKSLSLTFIEYIKNCQSHAHRNESNKCLFPIENDKRYVITSESIFTDGNTAGAIMFLSKDGNPTQSATDVDIKLIQAFALCISKQLPSI